MDESGNALILFRYSSLTFELRSRINFFIIPLSRKPAILDSAALVRSPPTEVCIFDELGLRTASRRKSVKLSFQSLLREKVFTEYKESTTRKAPRIIFGDILK